VSDEDACREVEGMVRALAKKVSAARDAARYGFSCDFTGSLRHGITTRGAVIRQEDANCDHPSVSCGPRWMEKLAVPRLPLIAWVEFNSGIE
jgi:hypothetical protein